MAATHTVTATFRSGVERAWKTPILGEIREILTGYLLVPPIVDVTEDATWGREGGTRIPHTARLLFIPGGPVGLDEVLVRKENEYWKWEVREIKMGTLFFLERAQGQYWVSQGEDGTARVRWTYTLTPTRKIWSPIVWLFTKIMWAGVMRRAIRNMQRIAESDAPFVYD